ncbi:glycosyltransferase family 2 protein [cf. Phormidesmis sp. LEGE 11477]|uniref:glycosyltransferase n=1 Tax=cf. Phormidesmis sp. LEGE 11477 TaxID=1828680 RepID=UPI0018826DE4|nr:glycosyltransferase [cf. Phormidesmis sp. LEGE 11477]MBE9060674.1 glycosyltransferase [cf. Phormidesmis sp. LEGE 11477]
MTPPYSAGYSEDASTYCPQVSVIVPIYNGEQDLPGLLDCLLSQTYLADRVEFLLVDNGSSDSTAQILSTATARFAAKGLVLKVLSETHIQSAYAARNAGIRAATGEILAFTDADCYPHSCWLSELVQPFQDSEVGLVAGEISALPGNNWLETYAERKAFMSQHHTLNHAFCPYGQTANLGVRVRSLHKVGLFRPYLTTGGDADICWRIQKEGGWKIQAAPKALVQHRHRQTLKELGRQWYRYGQSNRYLHELYGVDLARPLPSRERSRSFFRWLLKDLPSALAGFICCQEAAIEAVIVPLDIYCARARDLGQKEARLPDAARQKPTFEVTVPIPAVE